MKDAERIAEPEVETWLVDYGTGKIVSSTGRHVATMRPTCVNGEWEYDAGLIAGAPQQCRRLAELEAQVATLREEIEVDNHLIAERDRVLDALPCEAHGHCVPHALEAIEAMRAQVATLIQENEGLSRSMEAWHQLYLAERQDTAALRPEVEALRSTKLLAGHITVSDQQWEELVTDRARRKAEVEALKRERAEAQENEHQVRESFVQQHAARQKAEEERDQAQRTNDNLNTIHLAACEKLSEAEATIARMERYMRHYIGAEENAIAEARKVDLTDREAALSEEAGVGKTEQRCALCSDTGNVWNGLLQDYASCPDCAERRAAPKKGEGGERR